jgi:hypothetical protein
MSSGGLIRAINTATLVIAKGEAPEQLVMLYAADGASELLFDQVPKPRQ